MTTDSEGPVNPAAAFQEALAFVLKMEGGYQDRADDPGNRVAPGGVGGGTNAGVRQDVYTDWRKARGLTPRPVREIAPAEVEAIYRGDYWTPSKAGVLAAAGKPKLALVHFDGAVNCGLRRAALLLQQALDVATDGVIGPKTLYRAGLCDERPACASLLRARMGWYARLAELHPATHGHWLPDWKARLRWNARQVGVPIDPSYAKPVLPAPPTGA